MSKRVVVIFVIQAILMVLALLFGYVKNVESDYFKDLAHSNEKLAIESAKKADELAVQLHDCCKQNP